MTNDAPSFQQQYKSAETVWSDFKARRQTRDRLIRRQLPSNLPPKIATMAEGADYQTAEIQKAIGDAVDVLLDNAPIWDYVLYEDGARAKKWATEMTKWAARVWSDLDSVRAAWSEGQMRYGLGASILRWKSADKIPGMKDGYYRGSPVYWQDIDPLSVCALEGDDEEPEAVFVKFELPVSEAVTKGYTLAELKEKVLVGLATDIEDEATLWDKKLTFIVRDARVPGKKCKVEGCEHDVREITEWCSVQGSNDAPTEMDAYPSPFKCCSIFLVPARQSIARDPDWRYESPLDAAFTEAVIVNWLETLLITATREDYEDRFYMLIDTIPDVVLQNEEIMAMLKEYTKSRPDGNEIPIHGRLERYPKEISEHLVTLIQNHRELMNKFLINRFLTADLTHKESTDMPATAQLAQMEQAAKPFNRLYNEQDRRIHKVFMSGIFHLAKVWALSDPDIRFYAAASGKERLRVGSVDAGELLYISPEKLSIDFDLSLETRSETLEEQGQRQLLAWDLYSKGVISFDELLERCGIRDIEGMKQKLWEDRLEQQFAAKESMMVEMVMQRLVMTETGIDFGLLMGGMQPQLPPVPPQNGGVPPSGAVPATSLTGRNITPGPIQGAAGSAGGLG